MAGNFCASYYDYHRTSHHHYYRTSHYDDNRASHYHSEAHGAAYYCT